MKKNIIYIGNFSFPKENSSGIRVLNNGYLFRALGYEVTFIGLSKSIEKSTKLNLTLSNYDGFSYYSFPYPKKITDWIFFKEQLQQTIEIIKQNQPSIVVAYGSISNSFFTLYLNNWCKKNKIKIIHDCVDWLPSASGGLAFKIGKHIDTEIHKRYINASGDGVITVSNYLSNYYIKKGCKTLTIPPLSKESHLKTTPTEEKPITIIYAGFPFPTTRKIKDKSFFKDRLDIAIEILSKVNNHNFVFNIFGISKEDYLKVIPEHFNLINTMNSKVFFHGIVNNDDVIKNLLESDYFILIRDKNKMTQAGFPSKITEAISHGIPVIVTDTSDLKEYIFNRENGYIISDNDKKENQIKEIEEIINNGKDHADALSKNCVEKNPFLIDKFRSNAKSFIESI
ncbi:glycosyltransferase [Thiothrix winogradskyi]|uniref:Glycosyltransferase n=1 Tax=Thiothrix winogradskyi TaxID=96472 RepID=A0ABY3SYV3_9GAMM|nr:glycosyltransferase [Thiothrix winogradskyi]UJS24295.1 glycosyltransferase [Thiothrix winogradskyi]